MSARGTVILTGCAVSTFVSDDWPLCSGQESVSGLGTESPSKGQNNSCLVESTEQRCNRLDLYDSRVM